MFSPQRLHFANATFCYEGILVSPSPTLVGYVGPAVEHRSLAGVLSLSCVRLVADG